MAGTERGGPTMLGRAAVREGQGHNCEEGEGPPLAPRLAASETVFFFFFLVLYRIMKYTNPSIALLEWRRCLFSKIIKVQIFIVCGLGIVYKV